MPPVSLYVRRNPNGAQLVPDIMETILAGRAGPALMLVTAGTAAAGEMGGAAHAAQAARAVSAVIGT